MPDIPIDVVKSLFELHYQKAAGEAQLQREEGASDAKAGNALGVSATRKALPRVTKPAVVKACAHLLELIIEEAIGRMVTDARDRGDDVIDSATLERILPQLLLDF